MSTAIERRNQALYSLAEISINGQTTMKLDFLGTISIYGQPYFNVFRRYNNVYEFVFEDYLGDFHFQKDYTVSQTIGRILCLSEHHVKRAFVFHATAIHNQSPIGEDQEILSMRWSEIHHKWQGVFMNLGGMYPDRVSSQEVLYREMYNQMNEDERSEQQAQPQVPMAQPQVSMAQPQVSMAQPQVSMAQPQQAQSQEAQPQIQTPQPISPFLAPQAPLKSVFPLTTTLKPRNLLKRFREVEEYESNDTMTLRNGKTIKH
jgi:hypothetical protein